MVDGLRIVAIPRIVEGVDASEEYPLVGETAEDVLILAMVIVRANVELLHFCWIHARYI